MAIQDLHTRDLYRLTKALAEVRNRDASIIPDLQTLIGAMREVASSPEPMESWDDLGKFLVPIIGESIRSCVDLLRSALVELYGHEYTQELWQRFSNNQDGSNNG